MAVTPYSTTVGASAGQIGEVLQSEWLQRTFLDFLAPGVTLNQYGTDVHMPTSTARKARWLVMSRITPDASPTANTEGFNSPTTARTTDVTAFDATVVEYDDYIQISTLLDLTAINGTTQGLADLVAQLAKEQCENVLHVELENHALAADADISEIDLADNSIFDTDELFKAESLKRIAKKMRSGFVKPHPKAKTGRKFILAASNRIFFEYVGDSAAMSGGTNISLAVAQAVRHLSPSNPTTQADLERGYFDAGDTHPGMFGVELQLSESDRTISRTVNAGSVACQNNYVFGNQAFGIVDLQTDLASPAIIKKVPGPSTVSQPTNAFQTIGYRLRFASKLFQAASMMKFASV
jgi:hypothetical protein